MKILAPATQAVTMSSVEIAELVNKRHDNVKRTIEILTKKGVITSPQIEEKPTTGRPVTYYLFKGELGKRDSIIVVAQLSPEFTARLVDRWKELEEGKTLPQLSEMEMIAAIASNAARNDKRISVVEQKMDQMEQGTIPVGYQGYSYLQATYGLSNAKSKQLVMAWSVPHKKVPHVAPGGQVTQMSVVYEESFEKALHQMMKEAEQRGSQWSHPKMGRFSITGWKVAA
ncbi:Rha family transcriptional regulator [Xenorhabdus sp. XENO-7]|uniref:Rha family transcriptional regulator n=1 Tax=Xenorhabdus aichiensis TaxID=3025874 RepID=A0ABT5M9C8_9GAMM|nr:Rha family transcriptional regulator [Xenorhabdus aichiensis]MDC9623578.1 Rha family transcriptional regulator [Xenorhabdus aichiensis]